MWKYLLFVYCMAPCFELSAAVVLKESNLSSSRWIPPDSVRGGNSDLSNSAFSGACVEYDLYEGRDVVYLTNQLISGADGVCPAPVAGAYVYRDNSNPTGGLGSAGRNNVIADVLESGWLKGWQSYLGTTKYIGICSRTKNGTAHSVHCQQHSIPSPVKTDELAPWEEQECSLSVTNMTGDNQAVMYDPNVDIVWGFKVQKTCTFGRTEYLQFTDLKVTESSAPSIRLEHATGDTTSLRAVMLIPAPGDVREHVVLVHDYK